MIKKQFWSELSVIYLLNQWFANRMEVKCHVLMLIWNSLSKKASRINMPPRNCRKSLDKKPNRINMPPRNCRNALDKKTSRINIHPRNCRNSLNKKTSRINMLPPRNCRISRCQIFKKKPVLKNFAGSTQTQFCHGFFLVKSLPQTL